MKTVQDSCIAELSQIPVPSPNLCQGSSKFLFVYIFNIHIQLNIYFFASYYQVSQTVEVRL